MLEILFAITALFCAGLVLKKQYPGLCALCLAILCTWVGGLVALVFFPGRFEIDPVLVGILMGGSVIGVMYFLSRRVPRTLKVFTLPFVLTGVWGSYHLVTVAQYLRAVELVFLAVIWVVFGIVALGRNHRGTQSMFKQIVACCRDW
ncbi:MAG: hypothetical protein WD049_08250 [Candidatus Paceibacterota bacterium]